VEGRGKDIPIVWNCWSEPWNLSLGRIANADITCCIAEPLYNDISITSTTSTEKANADTVKRTKLPKGTKRRVETQSRINNKNSRRASEREEEEKTHLYGFGVVIATLYISH
jgi:hypothetical protein